MSKLDCIKMHPKCNASCCGIVPLPKDLWERNKHLAVNPHDKIIEEEGVVIPVTSKGNCVFLCDDYKCNIYEDRPEICRKYGDESHICMSCPYLHKDGKERSRQSQRKIQREIHKMLERIVKMNPKDLDVQKD